MIIADVPVCISIAINIKHIYFCFYSLVSHILYFCLSAFLCPIIRKKSIVILDKGVYINKNVLDMVLVDYYITFKTTIKMEQGNTITCKSFISFEDWLFGILIFIIKKMWHSFFSFYILTNIPVSTDFFTDETLLRKMFDNSNANVIIKVNNWQQAPSELIHCNAFVNVQ